MRIKTTQLSLFVLLIALVLVQETKAQFLCGIFNTCTSSSAQPVQSASPTPSSAVPSVQSSSALPSPPPSSSSAVIIPSSSSVVPSSKPPAPTSAPSARPSETSSSIASITTESSSSSTLPSTTPSTTTTDAVPKSSGSNIGVIVGSVCGFVAIIGAGFAYAFFSKTRKNNRNKRLYSENGDMYDHHNNYQPDPFSNTRPSPALAASAVAAADDIHQHNNNGNQWDAMDHQQSYGNYNNSSAMMSPQPPMAAVTTQHDPYYTSSPQMAYAVDPNANYYNNQPYYDHNMGYQQQHYEAHYDQQQHYAVEPQYDPYAVQHQQQQHHSPVMSANNTAVGGYPSKTAVAATNSTVYSSPNSYPDGFNKDRPTVQTTTTAANGSYR